MSTFEERYAEFKQKRASQPGITTPVPDTQTMATPITSTFEERYEEFKQKKLEPLNVGTLVEKDIASGDFLTAVGEGEEPVVPTREGFSTAQRAIFEGGGGIAGSLVPAPSVKARLGAAGLTFAIGKKIADINDELLGVKKPYPLLEQFQESTKAIITGATLEAIPGVVLNALSSSKKFISSKLLNVIETAKELGVDFSTAELKGGKFLSMIESLFDKTPWAGSIIDKFRMQQLKQLTDQRTKLINEFGDEKNILELGVQIKGEVDGLIKKMGLSNSKEINKVRDSILNKIGSNETYAALGTEALETLTARSAKMSDIGSGLFNKIKKLLPEGATVPIDNLKQTAKKMLAELETAHPAVVEKQKDLINFLRKLSFSPIKGITQQGAGSYGDEFLESIAAPIEVKSLPWEGIQKTRTFIREGKEAGDVFLQKKLKAKGAGTIESGIYSQLEKAANLDMYNFAKQSGGKVWDEFQKATKYWANFKTLMKSKTVKNILFKNKTPEVIVKDIIKPGIEGSVSEIKAAQRAIGTKNFNQTIRKSFTNKLLQVGSGKEFNQPEFIKQIEKYSDETLKALFPKKEEFEMLVKFKKAGEITAKNLGELQNNTFLQTIVKDPEKAADLLFTKNSSKNVRILQKILPEKTLKDLKRAVIEKTLVINKFGELSPAKSSTMMDTYKIPLKALFSSGEYEGIKKLNTLLLRSGGAERIAGNVSGTFRNAATYTTLGVILSSIFRGDLVTLGVTSAALISNAGLAKIYTSKIGRQLLTSGLNISSGSQEAAKITAKLIAIAGLENIKEVKPGDESGTDSNFVEGITQPDSSF